MLEFNRNVDGEVQLSETDLLNFIRIADSSWKGTAIPHLETLLRWPTGVNFFCYYLELGRMTENLLNSI